MREEFEPATRALNNVRNITQISDEAQVEETSVAIVGAGAAGLYCAWRLGCERPELGVAVFDEADQTGGRLRSRIQGRTPIELGAAFVSSAHATVVGLARELGCVLEPVAFNQAGAFLRGRWHQPGDGLFALSESERGKGASRLLLDALTAAAPALEAAHAGPQLLDRLQGAGCDGRALWQWPLRALLERTLSPEALAFAQATYGSTAAFGSVNALDAAMIHSFEAAPGQRYYAFSEGFQHFAQRLAHASKAEINTSHRLSEIQYRDGRFDLRFETPAGMDARTSRILILALPPYALSQIRFGADMVPPESRADLSAIVPAPAFKLFLTFDACWWRARITDLAGRFDVAAVHTDLALQQCYFTGEGETMLAAFADDVGTRYWRALAEAGGGGAAGDAPSIMIEAAMRQLRAMYGDIPEPSGGAYALWEAGWHAWRPGVRSWQVRERLRQPNPDLPLYLCGEAYALRQGWIEGAFNNAEATLERAFGLDRPAWAGIDSAPFASPGE